MAVEAICLAAGAAHVYTLEYAKLVTDHPLVHTMTPTEFLRARLEGVLPRFDAVVTVSSVEHSGLGRYSDGLNPWGDILAVARAWCVSAAHARLIIAVPTVTDMVGREARDAGAPAQTTDVLGFNLGRTYGAIRYPFLTTNWVRCQ